MENFYFKRSNAYAVASLAVLIDRGFPSVWAHYEGKVYIRKGTNAFSTKPEESRALHAGKIVV